MNLDELIEAYACWRQHSPWVAMASSQTHVCTPDCPLFRHRNLYVCAWSGHHHVCSDTACDRLVVSSVDRQVCRHPHRHVCHPDTCDTVAAGEASSRVCAVTGTAYELELQATYEQGAVSSDYRRRTEIVGSKRKRRTGGSDGMSQRERRQPQPTKSAIVLPADHRSRMYEAKDIEERVRALVPRLSTAGVVRTCAAIGVTWERVRQVATWSEAKFNLMQLVQTFLYAIKLGGAKHAGFVFVPVDEELAACLVDLDDQPWTLVTSHARTHSRKWTRHFNALMYEWIPLHGAAR